MVGLREYVILKKPKISEPSFLGKGFSQRQPESGLELSIQELTEHEAEDVRRDPNADSAPVMPLRLIEPKVRGESNTTKAESLWGLEAIGATSSSLTGEGVTVAVLDTGIDRQHKAFSHMKPDQLKEKDFTGDGDGDIDGHGTHCAGTIFGSKVNGVQIGIAPKIKHALIGKVIGTNGASTASLMRAMQWAQNNGANVVSMSLGIDFPVYSMKLIKAGYPPDLATSKALEAYRENIKLFDALGALINAGGLFGQTTILIAAAGNSSQRDINPEYTIAVEPPAASKEVLSVGAVARVGDRFEIAPFSNTGPDLVAPGVDILSARLGGGLMKMSGTSMATPHVAGAAILWTEYLQRKGGRITLDILRPRLTGTALHINMNQSDVGIGLVKVPPNE